MSFPPLLTEAQARAVVNLPPATGTPDAYTDRVLRLVAALTQLVDVRYRSTDVDGVDLWPTTEDLPEAVTLLGEELFRHNWSRTVGAHSAQFGPDRFDPDPPIGPQWVVSYYAKDWLAHLERPTFA